MRRTCPAVRRIGLRADAIAGRTAVACGVPAGGSPRSYREGRGAMGDREGEARRLNRFVANLLDMARVEAGALKLNIEPTDLTDAVASAVQDTRRTLEGHDIRLDVPPDLPLVRVDPQLFHHVLINLLDNA